MLFQAGSLAVFLLFWQVPDIIGETKTDKVLGVVSFISEKLNEHTKLSLDKFAELKQLDTLISDKMNEHTKLSQDKFTELKQEVDSLLKLVNQSIQGSSLNQDTCVKWQPNIVGTKRITLWGNTTALCDTTTDGGGWIIIQRRTNGDVNFFRGWKEYKTGFGNLNTGFWLGNNAIHLLAEQGYNELRIELIYEGRRTYAHYSNFYVASETMNYKLTIGAFEGTAGDSLTKHNNMYFSTFDRDNDTNHTRNCADSLKGAWWYYSCCYSNLNGLWGVHGAWTGMTWDILTGMNSVSFSEMKVRRG